MTLKRISVLALLVVTIFLYCGMSEATTYTQQNVGYNQQQVVVKQRVVEFDPRLYLGLNGYYTVGQEIHNRVQAEQLEALQEEHRQLKAQIQQLIDVISKQNTQPAAPQPTTPIEPVPTPVNPPPDNNEPYVPTSIDKQVYQVFKASCVKCHSENNPKGGIQLINTKNGALLNQPLEIRVLIERVVRGLDLQEDNLKLMPLGGQPLNDADLKVIYKWCFEEAQRLRETTE